MKKTKRLLLSVLFFIMMMSFAMTANATTKKEKITLKLGQTEEFYIYNMANGVTCTDAKWSVSNKKILGLNIKKGVACVTAKKKGKAILTGKKGNYTYKVTITVKDNTLPKATKNKIGEIMTNHFLGCKVTDMNFNANGSLTVKFNVKNYNMAMRVVADRANMALTINGQKVCKITKKFSERIRFEPGTTKPITIVVPKKKISSVPDLAKTSNSINLSLSFQ